MTQPTAFLLLLAASPRQARGAEISASYNGVGAHGSRFISACCSRHGSGEIKHQSRMPVRSPSGGPWIGGTAVSYYCRRTSEPCWWWQLRKKCLSFPQPAVLEDSNSVVAPGVEQAAHGAFCRLGAGRIDIWRTQPSFGTPDPARDISPFVESTPGAHGGCSCPRRSTIPSWAMPDTPGHGSAPSSSPAGRGGPLVIVGRPGGSIEALVVEP